LSTEELSKIVATKTRGNPFHITQFLAIIEREGLMPYNEDTFNWNFDVNDIQREFMVSETLADLLALRVKLLLKDVQECLKIASLLGYFFDEALVRHVATVKIGETSMETLSLDLVALSLSNAVKSGFIETTKEGFQFSHDKLQMTFSSMIDEKEKGDYHLIVREAFLARRNHESSYHAAVHLHLLHHASKN
jgi:predicted ATPase